MFAAAPALGQVADVDVRTSVLLEPSQNSDLTVINPALDVGAVPVEWLELRAGYEADIVSGATEALKSGPVADVVSGATKFDDTRHVVHGGVGITRQETRLDVDYSYGTESDYRSHSFSVSAGTEFFQKNTELLLSYARGFDRVCTSAYAPETAPSARLVLDSSDGCFTDAPNRASRAIDIDTLQAAWTQAWTPVFATQAVLSASLQHGFLENPYRAVVIAAAGQNALENHPDNRARGALSLRGKYFVKSLRAAFGAGVRVYRDTWDIVGQTYELEAEKYLAEGIRFAVRGRYYTQSGALFFSDDYTGGEPVTGPRGQYWTGDRELSSLSSLLLGGRLIAGLRRAPEARFLGVFLGAQVIGGFDFLNTELREFTWSGVAPDDTVSMVGSLALRGEF